jgi:hypothetical protein
VDADIARIAHQESHHAHQGEQPNDRPIAKATAAAITHKPQNKKAATNSLSAAETPFRAPEGASSLPWSCGALYGLSSISPF